MAKRKPIVTNFLDDDAPEQQQQTQKSRSNKPRRSPINTDFLDDVQVETQAEQVQPEPTQFNNKYLEISRLLLSLRQLRLFKKVQLNRLLAKV
jgi:hypothetical protein